MDFREEENMDFNYTQQAAHGSSEAAYDRLFQADVTLKVDHNLDIYYTDKEKELLQKCDMILASENEPIKDCKTTYWGNEAYLNWGAKRICG